MSRARKRFDTWAIEEKCYSHRRACGLGTEAFRAALHALASPSVIRTNIAMHPDDHAAVGGEPTLIEPVWVDRPDDAPLVLLGLTRAELKAEIASLADG